MHLPEFRNEPFTDFSRPDEQQAFELALAKVRKDVLGRTWPCWIGGQEVRGKETFDVTDPGDTSRRVGTYQKLGAADADRAVEAAHAAFPRWAATDVEARVRIFFEAAKRMRAQKHEFSALLCHEVGKSWAEADADTAECIDFLEYYAGQMLRMAQPQPVVPVAGERNEMRYIALGVGAIIPPWNFPLAIMAGMASAALLAGNTVVLKPASQSPAIAAYWVEFMHECGLPKDVLNFVTGPGAEVGGAMVKHRLTRFISFTGSRDVGLWIFEQSAKTQKGQIWMKRLVAEMGGKDSILVDKECDLDKAVDAVVASAFGFQGQKCSACSRVIVLESAHDHFLHRLVEATRALVVGDPSEPGTDIGPVIDGEAAAKIRGYVDLGRSEGKLELTLPVPDGLEAKVGKPFVGPAIVSGVRPDARVATEEIFGPVLAVIKARDFDEALRIANAPQYKLTGGIYSRKPANLERAKREFRVGNLYVNRGITGALVGRQPFGGFGMSGVGSKAGGRDYLLQFVEPRACCENTMRRGFAPGL